MIWQLFGFYWKEIPGPKLVVLAMPLVSATAQGMLLTTLNAAVEHGADGRTALHFAVLLASYLLASYFTMYKATEMTGRMAHLSRVRLCRKLAGCRLATVEGYGRGEVYAHITRDIDRLTGNALSVPATLHSAVLLLFCVAYVGWLSPLGMVVMVLAILLGVAVYFLQERAANDNLRKSRAAEGEFLGRRR